MPSDTDAIVGRLIAYLAGQDGYVSAEDIRRDRRSGLGAPGEAELALAAAAPLLEAKAEAGDGTACRLARGLDGYRAVFAAVRGAGADAYGLLASGYTGAVVNAGFIEEALGRIARQPFFAGLASKYPVGCQGDAVVLLLSRSPGFEALAAMFRASPAVAAYLLFPETLSAYELTHLKVALDLAFAADMLRRAPPATSVAIKYEVSARGTLSLETRGGAIIP